MLQPIVILVVTIIAQGHGLEDDGKCNGFQAEFIVKNVTGLWHLVGIVPGEWFPAKEVIPCFSVDFSETDEAGLRWLVNQTKKHPPLDTLKGLSVRTRYYTKEPFDVWSKAVEGVNGCFQQVLSLDDSNRVGDTDATKIRNATMPLHFLKTKNFDSSSPVLVQLLWSQSMNAVIYSRQQNINSAQLDDILKFMKELRKVQIQPRTCDWPVTPLM